LKRVILTTLLILLAFSGYSFADQAKPVVRIATNLGDIVIELDKGSAPATVENFISYVDSGLYNDTIFHRVIKSFMIQGGGFTSDMSQKTTKAPIANEAYNGLKNLRGTIAMARTSLPHSATSQFFINTVDNPFLDHKAKTGKGWGYCVFGRVIKGMDVVDTIEGTATTVKNGHRDVPVKTIVIEKAIIEKPSPEK